MISSEIGKFVKGKHVLDLTDSTGRYSLEFDFSPPGASQAARGWTFGVRTNATTPAENMRAMRDLQFFLDMAGEQDEPLYFYHKPRNKKDTRMNFEPSLGTFGRFERYLVQQGAVTPSINWTAFSALTNPTSGNRVTLNIDPVSYAAPQPLANVTGGVYYNTLGKVDAAARGVSIGDAETNKMTNPVFGHATYDTNWTAQANLEAVENRAKEFILFGDRSVKITAQASATDIFFQTINVGNTNTHIIMVFAKLNNSGTISNSNVRPYANSATVTDATYIEISDGWWVIFKAFTGVASNRSTGVRVTEKFTAYIGGVFLYERATPTAPIYGDMLGCAWTGTAHASTSTRTVAAAKWVFDEVAVVDEGTFEQSWEVDFDTADVTANITLFDTGTFILEYLFLTDALRFGDGTNSVSTSAFGVLTYGQHVDIHCTFHPDNGLNLYIDGALDVASAADYSPADAPTNVFLGSDTATGTHCGGIFTHFQIYTHEMSAAEVLASRTEMTALIDDDQMPAAIPMLWSSAGAGSIDIIDDSTHVNYAVALGIPGTLDALSTWSVNAFMGGASVWGDYSMVNHVRDYDMFRVSADQFYAESVLEDTVDANASGGNREDVTYPVGSGKGFITKTVSDPRNMTGDIHTWIRMKPASGTPTVTFTPFTQLATVWWKGADKDITMEADYRWYYAGPNNIPSSYLEHVNAHPGIQSLVNVAQSTSITLQFDAMISVQGHRMVITQGSGTVPPTVVPPVTINSIVFSSFGPKLTMSGYFANGDKPVLFRSNISLSPESANMVLFIPEEAVDITSTFTIVSLGVRPRFSIL